MNPVHAGPREHPLFPTLPYDLRPRARAALRDIRLQQFVNSTTARRDAGRADACRDAFGARYDELRRLAGAIRQHTLDRLDHYLEMFIDRAEAAGATVHLARDGAQANAIALAIARAHGCRLCVKSKSMVTEETHLVPALEAAGVETIETDLGEFILQLDGDAPSHIVTPMIHKDRASVGRTFVERLGVPYTDDPARLTAIARAHMRGKFRVADLGISGANFLIAETGSLVVCTNEGNADLSVGLPPVHVAFVGIEKLIPALDHLPLFLKLLARSATNQPITVYTTLITGPRRAPDADGPARLHIVLLDNGRSRLLGPPTRELLRCIRCGACLNACPVYRKVGGGHAYGAVYSGPIGAAITPLLHGPENYPDLPHASSLCGACHRACPVDIDIPRQLVGLRRELVRRGCTGRLERHAMRVWAWLLRGPLRYRAMCRVHRWLVRALAGRAESRDPFADRRWLARAPGPLSGWTAERDLPTPTSRSFRQWWRSRPARGPGGGA